LVSAFTIALPLSLGERKITDVLPSPASVNVTWYTKRRIERMRSFPEHDPSRFAALLIQRGLYRIAGHTNTDPAGACTTGVTNAPTNDVIAGILPGAERGRALFEKLDEHLMKSKVPQMLWPLFFRVSVL
jgi:hypothetical protein